MIRRHDYIDFRSEPGCSVFGAGGLKTKLEIDLTKPEGSFGSCGVKYNEVNVVCTYIKMYVSCMYVCMVVHMYIFM